MDIMSPGLNIAGPQCPIVVNSGSTPTSLVWKGLTEFITMNYWSDSELLLYCHPRVFSLGWSEKQKSWKMQKARADSKSRHTTDFRTVFEIMIGRFVSCEIGQTYFTESGVRFGTLERPDFRSFS